MADGPQLPATPSIDGGGEFDRRSLVSVVLLGLGAVLTAYAALQAGLMGSQTLDAYTLSSQYTTSASDLNSAGDAFQSSSELLFLEWSKARVTGDEEFAEYIVDTLMVEEQWEAVQWWLDNGDERGPFVDENEAWVIEFWDDADEFQDAADEAYEQAVWANDRGDAFLRSTVFFAVTLFFSGLASAFADRRIRVAVLIIAAVSVLVGAGVMIEAQLR